MHRQSTDQHRMSKTVIFVGGTAYSGSTMLDMILANDARGLSCGEVHAVFYPFRRKHLQLSELSDVIDWRALKKAGVANLYRKLFDQFPECDFIVDSSKSPLWISERSAELHAAGIGTENILIWKYPEEFRASRRKRGREHGWEREWINYHRYYFSTISTWRSVKYRELVTDSERLRAVCDVLSIPYHSEKRQYWLKEQHTVFGNDRARIHLHDPASPEYAELKAAIDGDFSNAGSAETHHRQISYAGTELKTDPDRAGLMGKLIEVLVYFDVANGGFSKHCGGRLVAPLRTSPLYHCYQVAKQRYGLNWAVDLIRG